MQNEITEEQRQQLVTAAKDGTLVCMLNGDLAIAKSPEAAQHALGILREQFSKFPEVIRKMAGLPQPRLASIEDVPSLEVMRAAGAQLEPFAKGSV